MKRVWFLALVLFSLITFAPRSFGLGPLAIPVIAIGVEEGVIAGIGALVAAGIISQAQADQAQLQVEDTMPRFDFDEAKAKVEDALASLIPMNSAQKTCETTERSSVPEGECRPEDRDSPFRCCPKFMEKFQKSGGLHNIGKFAYRALYFMRNARTVECCFEWDSMHGRFEVFQKSNHGPYKHLGERSCARDEDLDEDLCQATHPEKADVTSNRHAPRRGCP